MALTTGSLASWSDVKNIFATVNAEYARWVGTPTQISALGVSTGTKINASTISTLASFTNAIRTAAAGFATLSTVSAPSQGSLITPTQLNSINTEASKAVGVCPFYSAFGEFKRIYYAFFGAYYPSNTHYCNHFEFTSSPGNYTWCYVYYSSYSCSCFWRFGFYYYYYGFGVHDGSFDFTYFNGLWPRDGFTHYSAFTSGCRTGFCPSFNSASFFINL